MNRKKLGVLVCMMLVLSAIGALIIVTPAGATVTTGVTENPVPIGCAMVDFEDGTEGQIILNTIPGLQFTTTYGIDWRYGEDQYYNVNPYGSQAYECNGNFFAWLGVTGDTGRIDFTGGTASYFSILVSTFSGLVVEAYDADDNFLGTSGWAADNTWTGTFDRLTIEVPNMAYVIIHDTGNYWLIDDLVTDAPGVIENQPPAAVTDLAISESTYDSVTLTWTAPGDDNDENKASAYDIRYSSSPITEDNWEFADICYGEPDPEIAGERQYFTVVNLDDSTNYYFGLKSLDELPQSSKLSNIESSRTFPDGAEVPYIHQIWDTSFDGFDGSWACGPTSTIMLLTYLNRLVPWGGKCIGDLIEGRWKEKDDEGNILFHTSIYGKYLSKEYTFSGLTWDYLSYDKLGNKAYGAYGFIVPNNIAIAWRMQRFLWEHGLRGNASEKGSKINWLNINDCPNFLTPGDFDETYVQNELAKRHLIIAGTGLGCKSANCANSYCEDGKCGGGHVVLIIGYDEETSEYIVNDPYGNRLEDDYKNSNGRYVRYNWNTQLGHWVNKNPDCTPADCELVSGPSWIIVAKSYKDKNNGIPPQPENLKQCNEDGTEIPIGGSSSGSTIKLKGTIRDENNPNEIFDSVRLQVMIFKKFWNIFWFPIWIGESDFITCSDPNGQEVPIPIPGLPPGSYYWKARTIDVRGKASSWINYENNPGESDFIIPDPDAFINLECPVSLSVLDPDNLLINKFVNEIPGAFYNELDLDNDGELNDFIIIPNIKIGDYRINVIPEQDASPFDDYTLILVTPSKTIVLADNIQISDIPELPYIIRSTETEIFQIIPATIDIDPDTLNLNSSGKWITCYIELPDGYDVTDIDISTILLNDVVPAENHPTNIGDHDNDGIPDLMVKFDRQDVIDILEVGESVEIKITGELVDGIRFEGVDYIKVI
ncbi:MAG: hypothetical protein KAW45_06445 [Thermoplasmatales archaeon]|nr:hypothetical protein [Thermoplasmatales archaeon]